MSNEIKDLNKVSTVENTEDKGATMVEYVLMLALIAVVCIAAITFLGTTASRQFSTVGSAVGN